MIASHRVLVSTYLFLNGFGHFSFGWKEIKDSAGKNTDLQKVIIRFFTVRFFSFGEPSSPTLSINDVTRIWLIFDTPFPSKMQLSTKGSFKKS